MQRVSRRKVWHNERKEWVELRKYLKPGVWVEVEWLDTMNTVVLVLDVDATGFKRPTKNKKSWDGGTQWLDNQQITAILGTLQEPLPTARHL